MPPAKHYIPDCYHSATPYLYIRGAAEAINFYKNVFGATEVMRMSGPDGKIVHAEIKIGDSHIMLADENAAVGANSPQTEGGTTVGMMIYVEDSDSVFNKAIAAGAKEQRPMMDQFYGDRSGSIVDPFGHQWNISTHVEDVPPEEMRARMAKLGG